jgi:FMN phosphatase YigB (HAD superfamily)
VTTILFDIGATLMEGPREVPARRLAAALGGDEEPRRHEIRRLLFGSPYRDADELAALLCDALELPLEGVRPHLVDLWRRQKSEGRAAAGAAGTLRSFQQARWQVGFVSNIWLPYFEAFRSCFPEAGGGERGFFLSFREGVEKPAIELYERALSWTGERPENVVMVGDSYDDDIAPAQALGLKTVWVLSRPEKERRSIVEVLSGARPAPDWTVESIGGLTPEMLAGRELVAERSVDGTRR